MSVAATDVQLAVTAAGSVALYIAGVRAVGHRRSRPWPAWRTGAFTAGAALGTVALATPLADRAEELLSAHMVQHLLLVFGVAPLLVAGAPLALALRATRGAPHARLAALVRSRAVRALTHPLTAWTLFAGTLALTHLTGFYDLAVRDAAVHALEHWLYLATAVLFWLPVLGANPLRQLRSWVARTGYLMASMAPMSAVAVVLVYAGEPRYPVYLDAARGTGTSPLGDQQEAGSIMWIFGSMALAAAVVGLGWQALQAEERRQQRLEALEGTP